MINLVMALHCHQPIGNFDKVFEQAHEECYRPVLDLLDRHPGIKAGMHFSGCLLEWLEENKSGTIDMLAAMVDRGQLEMLSGGFYEPLLATIPEDDARGQVEMLNEYIERRMGRRPTGFWLTERIWDPGLPLVLHGTGMEYTIVDDTHFYYAGLEEKDIFGPYVTEKGGKTLKILATPMIMRYLIPFKQVEDVIGQLGAWNEAGRTGALYGDDGEKFGMWPGTHEWVIQKGWLDRFFTAVEENAHWLGTCTPGEYVRDNKPLGRLYMPQASYEEMTEWALPPVRGQALEDIIAALKSEGRWDSWRTFVRGGVWDNFLVKYDESNRIHKKMIFLSERSRDDNGAREAVWRAQCNCAYWHGVFGGLYMGHLRRALYENLIEAQAILLEKNGGGMHFHKLDYDKDGLEEIIIEGPSISLGLSPERGGSIFDVSYMPKRINLADVLTRRPEAYHRRLYALAEGHGHEGDVASIHDVVKVKEEGLEKLLKYDDHTRLSLVDHFFHEEPDGENLADGGIYEIGDFGQTRFDTTRADHNQDRVVVGLAGKGRVGEGEIQLSKTIRVSRAPLFAVDYSFENTGNGSLNAVYGCEFNLNLFSDQDEARYYIAPETGRRREVYETGSEYGLTRFDLINGGDGFKTAFTFSRPVTASFFPLMSVSMSEDGFEKSYQGSSFCFTFRLNLEPGANEPLRIDIEIIDL